jgi:hypothetical protein
MLAGMSPAYDELRSSIRREQQSLTQFGRPAPELLLYLDIEELESGRPIDEIPGAIDTWVNRASMSSWKDPSTNQFQDEPLMGDEDMGSMHSAMTSAFMTLNPTRNLLMLQTCAAFQGKSPSPPKDIFHRLYGMVANESGQFAGGIPPYLDAMAALDTKIDPLEILRNPAAGLGEAAFGQRNIPWVNARAMSIWLKLVNTEPDLGSIEMPNRESAKDFVTKLATQMAADLEGPAGVADPAGMRLMDRIYMLDLFLELCQDTSDRQYLDKAGTIVATFPFETREQWFDPNNGILMGDLIKDLHYYVVMTGDENILETAKFLEEYAPAFGGMSMGSLEEVSLLNGIDLLNSHAINIVIIDAGTGTNAATLLDEAQKGWDPRRVVQVLNAQRDLDLIQKKGLEVPSETSAFVCVNGVCGAPVNTPEGLRDEIEKAVKDIQAEWLL